MGPKRFRRLPTLSLFSNRVLQASHRSANIEIVRQEQTIGGNGPLLAQALLSMGIPSTLIGSCDHPLFHPLRKGGVALHPLSSPGLTSALEFTDGKLMLGEMGELNTLTIEEAMERLPKHLISSLLPKIEILATVNWTMVPLVEQFWNFLLKNGRLFHTNRPTLFVDLADPAKRPVADLSRCLTCLQKLQSFCQVVVGLNGSESNQIGAALSLPHSASLKRRAEGILEALQISSVIIHTHSEAITATPNGIFSKTIARIAHPARLTGAGDIFNAGYIVSLLRHDPPKGCLQSAVAASREFVRTGRIPKRCL